MKDDNKLPISIEKFEIWMKVFHSAKYGENKHSMVSLIHVKEQLLDNENYEALKIFRDLEVKIELEVPVMEERLGA